MKASGQMFSVTMFQCATAVKKLLVKALEHRCTFPAMLWVLFSIARVLLQL